MATALKASIAGFSASGDVDGLKSLVTSGKWLKLGVDDANEFIHTVTKSIDSENTKSKLTAAGRIEIGEALRTLASGKPGYTGSLGTLLQVLAVTYQGEADLEDFGKAAQYLLAIDVKASYSFLFKTDPNTPESKAKIKQQRVDNCVEAAELFHAEDELMAEAKALKAASPHLEGLMGTPQGRMAVFRCKNQEAHLLNKQRKFLDASQKYLESYEAVRVADENVNEALQNAFTCGILAKRGAKRDQHLGTLCEEGLSSKSSDSKANTVILFTIVENIHKNRFVRPNELKAFVSGLEEHQTGRGEAVSGIVRHNICAASQIYHNITFAHLGEILGVKPDEAEKHVAQMIAAGELAATIDQIDSSIAFASGAQSLQNFDEQIRELCLTMGTIVEGIATQYPSLMKSGIN